MPFFLEHKRHQFAQIGIVLDDQDYAMARRACGRRADRIFGRPVVIARALSCGQGNLNRKDRSLAQP